jgi:hypothetical protein
MPAPRDNKRLLIDLTLALITSLLFAAGVILFIHSSGRYATTHLELVRPCCDPGLSIPLRSSLPYSAIATNLNPTPVTDRKHGGVGNLFEVQT